MVTTIAKRIQSKLSRQGFKFSLGEIRPVYNDIVVDADNPTDAEITAIFDYFLDQASKLAPVTSGNDQSDENEPTVHNLYTDVDNQPEQETEPTVHNPYTSVDNLQAEETETSVCAGGEIGNIATPAQTELETLEVAEDVGAIALQETSELVASTAQSMGIVLNIEDVTAIASNFDYASTNSDDELEEIKAAIVGFVQHKSALSRQKITNIVQEVKDTIHHLDAENSQHLNDGLRSISEDIKSGSERFRNQTRQALKVFALPPSKAG